MKSHGLHLSKISEILFDSEECQDKAQTVLDAAAQAQDPKTARLLLPWRVHLFHRAQGGFWVCIDPNCSHRDPELANHDAAWGSARYGWRSGIIASVGLLSSNYWPAQNVARLISSRAVSLAPLRD